MPTISYVSIRRQGRVVFWLKLLLLSCERFCKPSYSQHSSANTFFIAGSPQPDKQLFYARSHWTPAPRNSSWNHHPKGLNWQHCCQRGPQYPSGAKNPGVMSTRSCSHHRHQGAPWIQPRAGAVCSDNVSLHSISFVNRARSSCTKYCNDSD